MPTATPSSSRNAQATLAHGGHHDNDYCFIFELENGLIKRVREYMDTHRGARCFETPSTV
jgi:uncharacterized protein